MKEEAPQLTRCTEKAETVSGPQEEAPFSPVVRQCGHTALSFHTGR